MALYNVITAISGLCLAGLIFFLIRRDYLHPFYSFWWILIALSALAFGVYPELSDYIAVRLKVGYPPVIVIVMAIVVLFAKSLLMDIERTRQKCAIRKLVQEVSLLKGELQWLKEKVEKDEKPEEF
ncbi:MAG: DUF2304 domain-containing protein [Deltaproteobacteria bacterium]|nr:DUF2304 domain-containing protein [Deltaproteobacteria bacterium]MBW2069464.1 DUF2304 domain-containing protein [Deltaproteobacteria bacterium]